MSEIPAPLANGRYTLANTLGQGGMATVYGGFDTMLEVDRAVKVLSPALCRSEKLRKRFLAEARAMAKLRHTNIVTVFDVGVEDDTPYIVMEMVKGGAVIDLMDRDGMLPPDVAGPIMLGALAGLQASHDRGVVHRDIKPHNMLMTTDGIVKITDFGIAHMQEDERSFTKTGAVMGTLAYMPPEQRQSAKGLGPTADIFAAGASLYALLTGQEPFDLYNEALYAKLFEGVPGELSQIVAKACSYLPEERYQTCNEMAAHLFEALRALDVPIAPDYRVVLQQKSDGTMYYDPDAPNEHAHSVAPSAKRDNTTINPKDTWFTNSGEQIGGNAKLATANSSERHIERSSSRMVFGFFALVLAAVVGVYVATSSDPLSTDPPVAEQSAEDAKTPVEATTETPDATTAAPEEPEAPASEDPTEVAAGEEPVAEAAPEVASAPPAAAAPSSGSQRRAAAPARTPVRAAQPAPAAAPEPTPAPTPTPAPARAARRPAPEPTPTGPAKLTINSSPRSSVTINGIGVGQTWVRNHELDAGTHRVVLQPTGGGAPKVLSIPLTAGQRKVVCWDFDLGAYCPRR